MDVVTVSHLWKRFSLVQDRADSVGKLLARMLPGRQRPRRQTFWALQDVDFTVPQGRSLGIIGPNGSGKSTLLKILTRTMRPTSGWVALRGRCSALIELGAGFHPDFTGRENVYLNASLLGLPRRLVDRQIEAIIDFAEIRPFIDTPVKYYSSGMQARLGFSVAIHVEPDVLIVDEVLAVGDLAFQAKCMERILTMKSSGVSILLVSHDLSSVERLMDEALWLDHGVVRARGRPEEVVRQYRGEGVGEAGRAEIELCSFAVRPEEGRRAAAERVLLEIVLERPSGETPGVVPEEGLPEDLLDGFLVLTLRQGGLVIARADGRRDGALLSFPAGQCRIELELSLEGLPPGGYDVDVALYDRSGTERRRWRNAGEIRLPGRAVGGALELPHRWRVVG